MRLRHALPFLLFTLPAAAICNDKLRASTPSARFVVNANGTATDRRTGLTWQRCPIGTVLDDAGTPTFFGDDRCVPSPGSPQTFTWAGALGAAQQLDASGGFGGFSDWRVPNRKELLSLVETRCTSPAINAQVFPDTPSGGFFTSTAVSSVQTMAWTMDFSSGSEIPTSKTSEAAVRLVR